MFSVPNGKPGVLPGYLATPREVFAANRQFAQFVAGSPTVDGFNTSSPSNAPYTWQVLGGTLMGRVSATGKYANSVLGQTTAAYAHAGNGTAVQTDVNTAAEVVRRLGASGTFKLTGPPTAGGVVATQTLAYSAVNLSTGVITVTAGGADAVVGSFIQPVDGSEVLVTVLCDVWGKKVADATGTTRVDVFDAHLLAAGGTVNTAMLVNYPADPSLKAWVKAGVRVNCPGVNFSDDFTG